MGLYSMPDAGDAFFRLVFFAGVVMPLVLLKDWIIIQVTGYEESVQDSTQTMSPHFNDDDGVLRDGMLVGVEIRQFKELCFGYDDEGDTIECCVVCLHVFDKAEEIKSSITACIHFFHWACLERWLLDHCRFTCPLCRMPTSSFSL